MMQGRYTQEASDASEFPSRNTMSNTPKLVQDRNGDSNFPRLKIALQPLYISSYGAKLNFQKNIW